MKNGVEIDINIQSIPIYRYRDGTDITHTQFLSEICSVKLIEHQKDATGVDIVLYYSYY